MKKFLILSFSLFLTFNLFAQEISQKKDIAIFRLGYYSWTVPMEALGPVDEEIKNVFINLGRFNVLGMTHRMDEADIAGFIVRIKEYKEIQVEIPEEVRFGQTAFTEADFRRLVDSFIVVIPVLSYYSLTYNNEKADYSAELETSFTFVNIEEGKSFAHFTIKTIGSGKTGNEAVRSAVSSIPAQLSFEIRKIPEFQIKTGILELMGRTAIIQFGKDRGVLPGDEFVIIDTRILPSGLQLKEEAGLLVIKEVQEEFSYAYVLFAKRGPFVGDQLFEVPRFGTETAIYSHAVIGENLTIVAGLRQVLTRGFYKIRPLLGLEFPFGVNHLLGGAIGTAYLGAELNWNIGRFAVTPLAGVGLGADIILSAAEEEEKFVLSHAGGLVQLSLGYLLNKNVRLFIDGGYRVWFSVKPGIYNDIIGLYGGAGITIKY